MKKVELWGGIECTLNRVGDQYLDQLEYTGHYRRSEKDIDTIATLNLQRLRYPILWEKHAPQPGSAIDWTFTERSLNRLQQHSIIPIAGLVHHGSGPRHVNFFDGSFEEGLATYAKHVAQKFPWLQYYTPVNEPLTTARFCGLYGHWFPHAQNSCSFYKILLSECKAIVMAIKAIRTINPAAELVQTEDLSKTYSTPAMQHQAEFENNRRWLSYDLLCGTVDTSHPMWDELTDSGIKKEELFYFLNNPCIPQVAGLNYYITSERYLDERTQLYPKQFHGTNGCQQYADVEAVRVALQQPTGLEVLLREAWKHLNLPMAITESHLHCTDEHRLRWLYEAWTVANRLQDEGIPVNAVTEWSLFGACGWTSLVTRPGGEYEQGVFDVCSGEPVPTAMAAFMKMLKKGNLSRHPALQGKGWWQLNSRVLYGKKTKPVPCLL